MQIFERFYEKYESTISWRGGNPDVKFIQDFKKGEIKERCTPTELLPLGSYDHDKFLDLFNNEFNRISEVLIVKRTKRLAKKAETEKQAKLNKNKNQSPSVRTASQLGTTESSMMAKARASTNSIASSA
jgi:hypothetical protein